MLLTLSTTYSPATDLGYLLHKNPFRAQAFQVSFGKVYVFYPESRESQCSASVLVDLDLTGLIQERRIFPRDRYLSSPYLTDIPYCASTFLSSAIAQVLGTAMMGQSRERPELAKTPIPLKAEIMLLVSEEESLFTKLFEPLGYTVSVYKNPHPEYISPTPSYSYYTLTLEKECLLSEILSHLYVLLPVFDTEKHFWFRDYELDRFLQRGEGWLEQHPQHKSILDSYQRHPGSPLERAVIRILGDTLQKEETPSPLIPLQENLLLEKIAQILREVHSQKVVVLQCHEGRLLKRLSTESSLEEIVGMDISSEMLEKSRVSLNLEEDQMSKVRLIHGSLIYQDKYLQDFDTAILVGMLPYLEKEKRSRLEQILFEFTHPEYLIFAHSVFKTISPNETSPDWTQEEFQQWGQEITKQFPYTVTFSSLENTAPKIQQIALFLRKKT